MNCPKHTSLNFMPPYCPDCKKIRGVRRKKELKRKPKKERFLGIKRFLDARKKVKCKHPLKDSSKIATVIRKPHNAEFEFVIDVRRCSFCDKYFIDQGFELRDIKVEPKPTEKGEDTKTEPVKRDKEMSSRERKRR